MAARSGFADRLERLRKDAPPFPEKLSFPLTKPDAAALCFIGFILFIFATFHQGLSLDKDSDQHYHMGVARRTLELGRLPEWDDWEFAPAGRPHLYPPGLHIVLAALAGRPEKIPAAFRFLQVIAYPAALLAAWWFIRWLFGDRAGFMGLLLLSMDMPMLTLMLRVVPSGLVTALLPLMLAAFLTRRRIAMVLLVTLALYIHAGIALLAILGLLMFALRYRGYLAFFAGCALCALLLFSPWIIRTAANVSWLNIPGMAPGVTDAGFRSAARSLVLGILWTQFLNPLLVAAALWGFISPQSPRCRPLRWVAAGFLPILFVYGGRFWMHAAPLWAVFGGTVAARLLPKKRALAAAVFFAACTAIPIPSIYFHHRAADIAIIWSKSGLRQAIECIAGKGKEGADFARLARFIAENTAPREIVHIEKGQFYLGDRIYVATGRRVDIGGWAAEVTSMAMLKTVEEYRAADTDCLFVYTGAPPAEMGFDRIIEFGKYAVGVRGKHRPLEQQTHPAEPAAPAAP